MQVDPWAALAHTYTALHVAAHGTKVDPTAPGAYVRLSHRLHREMLDALRATSHVVAFVELHRGHPVIVTPEPRVTQMSEAIDQLADHAMDLTDHTVIVRARDLAAARAAARGLFVLRRGPPAA